MFALVRHDSNQEHHLLWCFKYIFMQGGHNPKTAWLKKITPLEFLDWKMLQARFQEHGYLLELSSNLLFLYKIKTPAILKVKHQNYVLLHQITEDGAWIEDRDTGVIQIQSSELESYFEPIIISIDKTELFYEKPLLNRQIIKLILNKFWQFKWLSFTLVGVLFFYELVSLVDPILLNIVVDHLDLFGSTFDLGLTFGLLAGMTGMGLTIAYFRQRLWTFIFGEFSMYLTQDLMKQVFNLPLFQHQSFETSQRFTRLYSMEQIYYRFLQQVFFTATDGVFIGVHFLLMCVLHLGLAGIDLVCLLGLFAVNE